MSSLRRGASAIVAALTVMSVLSACGGESKANSNFAPASNTRYAPVNGVNVDSTYVLVRNLYLLAAEGIVPARMRMTMVNATNSDDALVNAAVGQPAVAGRLFGGTLGVVPVVAGTSVIVGSNGGPQITFRGVNAKAGTWVPVLLQFRSGRSIAASILVLDAVSEYSDGTVPTGRPQARPTVTVPPPNEGTTATPGQ